MAEEAVHKLLRRQAVEGRRVSCHIVAEWFCGGAKGFVTAQSATAEGRRRGRAGSGGGSL